VVYGASGLPVVPRPARNLRLRLDSVAKCATLVNMKRHTTTKFDATKAMRRMAWLEKRADMAEGRRPNRATTIPDARRKASKAACRGKVKFDA
jgi:hypothetical protein